jgi:hypothetical protein
MLDCGTCPSIIEARYETGVAESWLNGKGLPAVSTIERIRETIRERDYYLSLHAEEEMAEDAFERPDVENAFLRGFIHKKMTHDARGTRFRIEGPATVDKCLSCRFPPGTGNYEKESRNIWGQEYKEYTRMRHQSQVQDNGNRCQDNVYAHSNFHIPAFHIPAFHIPAFHIPAVSAL